MTHKITNQKHAKKCTSPNGTTETEYNDANLPTVVYRNGSHIYNAFYDRSGNMTMLEDAESMLTLEYTYDSANRLSNELQCNYFDLTEENKAWSYSFDLLGNRTNMGKSDYANSDSKTYAYTYDNHNRLETVAVSIDNQLQHTIDYAWPGGSGASFSTRVLHKETFDTDEMLIGLELYAYDVRGRLTEFGSFDDSATYTYNGDNLRETKSSGAKETTFVYDGGDIVAEIISSGETEEIITYGRGLRLFCRMKNNVASYYFYNLHGDVVKLISETGATETVRYDAHGNFIGDGFTDNPFGYSGEYHDKESGFIYLRARYYDPETGRFISEDPAMDGTNWYVYCSNNPVMFVDPSGMTMRFSVLGDAQMAISAMNQMGGYNDKNGYSYAKAYKDGVFVGYDIVNASGDYSGGSETARALFSKAISDPNIISYNFLNDSSSESLTGRTWVYNNDILIEPYDYSQKGTAIGNRYAKINLTLPSEFSNETLGLVLAHETAHGLAWNLKLDQNIYYTSMVGIAELRDIHKYWQEAVAINIQYLISSQLGDKYIGNVANIYYPKNNMYYTLDGDEIYGASPIVYSSYIDPIKKVPTSKSWYRGMPLTAAIYQ